MVVIGLCEYCKREIAEDDDIINEYYGNIRVETKSELKKISCHIECYNKKCVLQ